MTVQKEIADALKAKTLVIGTKGALKGVKRGTISSIIHASPLPEFLQRDLERLPDGVSVKAFEGDAIRLGQVCGKPFKILTLGVKK